MKSRIRPLVAWFAAACSLVNPSPGAAPEIATQLDLSSATTPAARKFYFETTPGQRYSLWRSSDLSTWQEVAGFPKVADGMSLEYTFPQQDKEFFQIEPIDEQAPTVVSQYPAVDGFAVGRFADLNIQLADATGINPASVRLTVGTSGQLALGAAGLTISGNTITYDSGDVALGAWGATISATLIAADTLGHTLTHTWSFRLEPEPQVAANIFVFGSPTAQRAGQRVSGPAAALAARFPAPTGPVKASDPPPWQIDSVLVDRVVIAYEAGGAPSFAAGQLICNLAPAKESEIFYRRVVSTSNDAGNLKLTVMTSEAALTDFVQQAAVSITPASVVFETDNNGTLIRSLGIDGTLTFPRLGCDLSGASIKLTGQGSEARIPGLPPQFKGSGNAWFSATASEWSWWLTPRVHAALEIENWKLKSLEADISGQISSAFAINIAAGAGYSVKGEIFDAPVILSYPLLLGVIPIPFPPFGIPVYATANFGFSIDASADFGGSLEFGYAFRQEMASSFGMNYNVTDGFDFFRTFQASAPDIQNPSLALTGQFGVNFTLKPKTNFLVYSLAGLKASIEPSVGVKATASTQGTYGASFEAAVDFVLGPDGPAFKLLGLTPELSVSIWHGEWPLFGNGLEFKTHPQSRTAAPGDDVSFTCTVDSPAPPSFQWYQNGRLLPGQTSRSLFLPFVNAGHAGSYSMTAKSALLAATSNSATLTVRATTPENLDADGDGIPNLHETNTGNWVSTTSRGTNPNHWDSDGDGLSDAVETNTGIYVSRSNTGTNPNKYDTDGDGINDKREIDLGTEPNPPSAPTGMALIPAGSFQMGDQSNPLVGWSDERPVHSVHVSAFYMGRYEVTKEEWDAVRAWGMASGRGYTDLAAGNGSYASKGANHPVHSITWYDMVKWCNARSEKENLTPCYTVGGSTYKTGQNSAVACNWNASGYRLPTEAEWEKAARGTLNGKNFPWGDTISHSQENYSVYSPNGITNYYSYDVTPRPPATGTDFYHPSYTAGGNPYSSPVGSFAPNGSGLYDMAGNMAEYCWDCFGSYPSTSQTDPRGPTSHPFRVVRGGGWFPYAFNARCAFRGISNFPGGGNAIGFRLARSSVPQ